MKKNIGVMLVSGVIALHTGIVFSEQHELDKRFYISPQIGRMDVDLGAIRVDIDGDNTYIGDIDGDLLNPGLLLGYNINKHLSIEGQYITTIASSNVFNGNTVIDVEQARSSNLYGVFRSKGKVYLKLKAGLSYTDVNIDVDRSNATDSGLDSADVRSIEKRGNPDFEFSYGLGFGVRLSSIYSMELEATQLTNDIFFYGLNFKFDL